MGLLFNIIYMTHITNESFVTSKPQCRIMNYEGHVRTHLLDTVWENDLWDVFDRFNPIWDASHLSPPELCARSSPSLFWLPSWSGVGRRSPDLVNDLWRDESSHVVYWILELRGTVEPPSCAGSRHAWAFMWEWIWKESPRKRCGWWGVDFGCWLGEGGVRRWNAPFRPYHCGLGSVIYMAENERRFVTSLLSDRDGERYVPAANPQRTAFPSYLILAKFSVLAHIYLISFPLSPFSEIYLITL